MSEYEQSIMINAPRQQIEAFVADVKNLPKYLPTTKQAMPEPGERVRVKGDAHGHHYDSDGYFHMDQNRHRMEWGSDGEEVYRGWLAFQEENQDKTTKLTVHLTFEPNPKMKQELAQPTSSQDETIRRELEASLKSIKNIIEGHGGKLHD